MTEITIDVDDVHELMFEKMAGDDVELDEWAQDALHQLIYNAYQNQEDEE